MPERPAGQQSALGLTVEKIPVVRVAFVGLGMRGPDAVERWTHIPGIEVMDLEDAVKVLWKAGIYAESGMGCTGPLVMMSDANAARAAELLKEAGYIG